jgi:septal ring factor EnvC (AmiA/AmiB activator)
LDGSVVLPEEPLGLIQSFNSIIESVITKAPIEDSDASFGERDHILSKMKANLDYVQSSHHRMKKKKSEYTKYTEENDAVEAQKEHHRKSLSQMYSMLEKNDASMAERQQRFEQLHQEILHIQQEIEQHRQNGQIIEKDIGHSESELKRLGEVSSAIDKAQDKCKHDILSIAEEVRQTLQNV